MYFIRGCAEVDLWVGEAKRKKHGRKQSFYDELKGELDMSLGDFNGYVDRHIDRFDGVHRRYGTGPRNFEGRMSLVLCLKKETFAQNTWLKREEKKMTFGMRK